MATRKTAPKFSKLSKAKKEAIAKKIAGAIRAMAFARGGQYKVVNVIEPGLRERGYTEHENEDQILSEWQRGAMLNLARNQARNSSTLCSILKQFDLQAVGTTGGKATFVFDDPVVAEKLRGAFAAWARNADFFDGLPLNAFLKLVLKTYILGGDMVLLFDDNMIEDSGRLLIYEPDEIGNLSKEDFAKAYGDGYSQSLGRVYNANARFCGAIVSRSCRGEKLFALDKSYTLKLDPNASVLDSAWIMPRNVFRVAQGRGVSPLCSSLATIIDLEDLTNYELQAAKKNSQTLAQVVSTDDREDGPVLGSALAGSDFSGMTDDEINAAVMAEAEEAPTVVTLDQIRGAGVLYEAMPDRKKLELLDTKHPNANMPEFIRWLAGRSAAPFGLGSVYATLKADASYTAFRGEQVMSQPAFEEAQKFLEGVCDWIIYRWAKWAVRKNVIGQNLLPANWLHLVTWQWPKMREVNQVDEQNAVSMKLKNGTGSYLEIYGADWKEKLAQIAEEIKFCKSVGLPHPALQTVSGGIIETNNKEDINE